MSERRATPTDAGRNPHGDGSYIAILDGWRAVAILLVLAFHGAYNSDLSGYPSLQFTGTILGHIGALGVLVFFSISGYLITQRLLVETRLKGQFSIREFYIKRAFRILPPLTVYLLVAVLLFAAGVIALQPRDWMAMAFLTNYFQGSWYTSHFWSLSVEEHFYLFWPVCAWLIGWRKAMWVGVGLICAVAVWRPWVLHHAGSQASASAALQHTDLRIDYIMMGAVVALAVEFYPSTVDVLKKMGSGFGLLALTALLFLSTRQAPVDLRTVQAMLITLIVCASTLADAKVPRLLLANRPMLFLGKVSYSLYIWQELFLAPTSGHGWGSVRLLPLKFGAALLTAYASYRFVEKPFIRYGRNLLARHETRLQREA